MFVRDQFAGARNLAGSAELWVVSKPGRRVTEKLVQSRGRPKVIGCDVQPDVVAILFRFGRPNDFHGASVALARRAANLASTSSLERPIPARMDTLPASTLLARKASYSRAWRCRSTNSHQLAEHLGGWSMAGLGFGHELVAQLGLQLHRENGFFGHDQTSR